MRYDEIFRYDENSRKTLNPQNINLQILLTNSGDFNIIEWANPNFITLVSNSIEQVTDIN